MHACGVLLARVARDVFILARVACDVFLLARVTRDVFLLARVTCDVFLLARVVCNVEWLHVAIGSRTGLRCRFVILSHFFVVNRRCRCFFSVPWWPVLIACCAAVRGVRWESGFKLSMVRYYLCNGGYLEPFILKILKSVFKVSENYKNKSGL